MPPGDQMRAPRSRRGVYVCIWYGTPSAQTADSSSPDSPIPADSTPRQHVLVWIIHLNVHVRDQKYLSAFL